MLCTSGAISEAPDVRKESVVVSDLGKALSECIRDNYLPFNVTDQVL